MNYTSRNILTRIDNSVTLTAVPFRCKIGRLLSKRNFIMRPITRRFYRPFPLTKILARSGYLSKSLSLSGFIAMAFNTRRTFSFMPLLHLPIHLGGDTGYVVNHVSSFWKTSPNLILLIPYVDYYKKFFIALIPEPSLKPTCWWINSR